MKLSPQSKAQTVKLQHPYVLMLHRSSLLVNGFFYIISVRLQSVDHAPTHNNVRITVQYFHSSYELQLLCHCEHTSESKDSTKAAIVANMFVIKMIKSML